MTGGGALRRWTRFFVVSSTAALLVYGAYDLWRWSANVSSAPLQNRMECTVIELGTRCLDLENPYPDPVHDRAVAFLYPPAASIVLAVAWRLGGETLLAPRAVSFVGIAAAAGLLGWYAGRRRGAIAGLWAAGAWLSLQGFFQQVLTVARVDSLTVVFSLAALLAGSRALEKGRGLVAAALLATLAFYTKQQGAAVPIGISIAYLWRRDFRGLAVYGGTFSTATLAIGLVLHLASDGWSTRTLLLGFGHPLLLDLARRCVEDLLLRPPIVALAILVALSWRRGPPGSMPTLAAGAILCFLTATKLGGHANNMAPAVALAVGQAAFAIPIPSDAPRLRALAAALAAAALPCFAFDAGRKEPSRAELAETIESQRKMVETGFATFEKQRGPALVSGYHEFAWLLRVPLGDDMGTAYEYDLAGVPALERIIGNVERKRYGVAALEYIEGIRIFAEQARRVGRPATGERLDRFLRVFDANYRPLPLGPFIFVPRE